MFAVLYSVALVLALLAQTSPLLFTVGAGLRVDLALLVVVYVSLYWRGRRALWLGFLTGFCHDALSSEELGLNALSKTLSAFAVSTLCRNVQVQSIVAQGLFTALAITVDTLVRITAMLILQWNAFTVEDVVRTYSQQTLLSMLLMPVCCRLLHRLAWRLRVPVGKGADRGVV